MTVDPLVAELRDRREKAGLTQRQLADAMHCVQSHVSMLEAGRTDLQLDTLRRWAAALGVQPAWVPLTPTDGPGVGVHPAGNGAHADAPASAPVEVGSDLDRADVAPCPDCAAHVGAAHSAGCDVARCLVTGLQRLSCGEDHWCGADAWTGTWPAVARTLDVAERTVEKAREERR